MTFNMDDLNYQIQETVEMGKRNLETLNLARNFCKYFTAEKAPWRGSGLVEQITGLPTGFMICKCKFARNPGGISSTIFEDVALNFYENNCIDCDKREPLNIPNLLMLVEKRKKREKEAQIEKDTNEVMKSNKLAIRKDKRAKFKTSDQSHNSILDLIDKVDTNSQENRNNLIETAKIAPEKFDSGIQEALFDLIDTAELLKAECAIQVLTLIANKGQLLESEGVIPIVPSNECKSVDLDRLLTASLKALDDGSGYSEAATVIEFWFNKRYCNLLSNNAINTLIYISYPASPMSFVETGVFKRPGPLLKVYDICPDKVLSTIQDQLQIDEKYTRISACGAAKTIILIDSQFGIKISDSLIKSLRLRDDHYNGSSARTIATDILAMAFIRKHSEIDRIIQESIEVADSNLKGEIFSVYGMVLSRKENEDIPEEIVNLAIKRVLDTLIISPNDKRMEKASKILRFLEHKNLTCLIGHEKLLLGAAAQLSQELESPNNTIIEPGLDSVAKFFEIQSKHMHLNSALDSISRIIGDLGALYPLSIGNEVVQHINNLKDRNFRFKSMLITSLGRIGSTNEGLPLVLPILYSGFVDNNVLVRHSAIKAYGKLMVNNSDSLPTILHELFCASLSDPYVIVHKQAVYTLMELYHFKEDYVSIIKNNLLLLILTYYQNRSDLSFLSECIKELLRFQPINLKLAKFVLGKVHILDPYDRVSVLRCYSGKLREIEGFSFEIAKLLSEEYLYDLNLDEVVEMIKDLPEVEISKIGDVLESGIKKLINHRLYYISLEIIEFLSLASCWDTVLRVIDFFVNSIEDTIPNKDLKLRVQSYQIACRLESAIFLKNSNEIERYCHEWNFILDRIEKIQQ